MSARQTSAGETSVPTTHCPEIIESCLDSAFSATSAFLSLSIWPQNSDQKSETQRAQRPRRCLSHVVKDLRDSTSRGNHGFLGNRIRLAHTSFSIRNGRRKQQFGNSSRSFDLPFSVVAVFSRYKDVRFDKAFKCSRPASVIRVSLRTSEISVVSPVTCFRDRHR